jgi:hypothetical protein
MQGVFQKEFATVFRTLLRGECYERPTFQTAPVYSDHSLCEIFQDVTIYTYVRYRRMAGLMNGELETMWKEETEGNHKERQNSSRLC